MIPKPIDQITEADLADLVTAGVGERRTIDYKQQLPGKPGQLLKPTLDLVWNACGRAGSPHFDEAGNWKEVR